MATLIGDGAHARDIASTLPRLNEMWSPYWVGQEMWTVVPHHGEYVHDVRTVIGINDPRLRDEVATELGISDLTWIHPDALIQDSTIVNAGTHINYGVTMTRTTIGHHTTISPGVTICGDVTIGDRTLIGAGATICDRVTIGSDVTIGAGAVVLPETSVPDGETWVGVPARRV